MMYNLFNYITEVRFSKKDFYNPAHTYKQDVISSILSKGILHTGVAGTDGDVIIDDSTKRKLQDEFSNVNIDKLSKEEFDEIMTRNGLPCWNKIFKGEYSGYIDGLSSRNRGNAFEDEYIRNWKENCKDLAKVLDKSYDELLGFIIKPMGNLNQKRPLKSGKNGIVLYSGNISVGDILTDIILANPFDKKETYNLSLKFGNTCTFCNIGIKRLFSGNTFKEYLETGQYIPSDFGNVKGQDLLDMFCIDNNRFADIFVSYGNKKLQNNETVDITKQLKDNIAFHDFLESAIGYNYILIHKKNNGDIEYTDLRDKKDYLNFVGDIHRAKVYYGGIGGDGKRIDIIIDTTNLKLKINIRSKDGSIYPTHLMCDYIVKH